MAYCVQPHIRFRREPFGGIVFNSRTFSMLKVNKTAYSILESLNIACQEADLHQVLIAQGLAENNEEDRHAIGSFLAQLATLGIITQ